MAVPNLFDKILADWSNQPDIERPLPSHNIQLFLYIFLMTLQGADFFDYESKSDIRGLVHHWRDRSEKF